MIDYKIFTINTNIILLFNNVFSKLFYTISFINYCNCYKLYTQCWPYQIFVHGALNAIIMPMEYSVSVIILMKFLLQYKLLKCLICSFI